MLTSNIIISIFTTMKFLFLVLIDHIIIVSHNSDMSSVALFSSISIICLPDDNDIASKSVCNILSEV